MGVVRLASLPKVTGAPPVQAIAQAAMQLRGVCVLPLGGWWYLHRVVKPALHGLRRRCSHEARKPAAQRRHNRNRN